MSDWTIDTNILYKVAKGDIGATTFLMSVKKVYIDNGYSESEILVEYRRCLTNNTSSLLNNWFKQITTKQSFISIVKGKPTIAQEAYLKKIKFDISDWKFVITCSNSPSRKIVAEESDYIKVKSELEEFFKISILSCDQAK
jgi:hypothetical protein